MSEGTQLIKRRLFKTLALTIVTAGLTLVPVAAQATLLPPTSGSPAHHFIRWDRSSSTQSC
jgi:hypothetical protein